MPPQLSFEPIHASDAAHADLITDLWLRACGDQLAISPRFVTYSLQPSPGGRLAAVIAWQEGQAVGFVSASLLVEDAAASPPDLGYLDALAVVPEAQRQGVGSALLAWAEGWLVGQGCRRVTVGKSLRPFAPGVPVELGTRGFFEAHGYAAAQEPVWDVAADLSGYTPPATVREIDGQVRPAQPRDHDALLAFLRREFNGRWRYEFEAHVQGGGRIADYMVLWTNRGIDGCCVLTFEDSLRPIERFYPYQLPRAWGQLGSIGVSEDRRGRGYGAALMDAGLRRLHSNGVNGCVIDWTNLLDFYAKFGFTPYRQYDQMSKQF